jgi:hypothetical protein
MAKQEKKNEEKRKRKRLVMGGTHNSFSSHRHRSSGACLNERRLFPSSMPSRGQKKQHRERPDSRLQKRRIGTALACFIFIPAPSSLLRLSLLAFD